MQIEAGCRTLEHTVEPSLNLTIQLGGPGNEVIRLGHVTRCLLYA